ncbi:hypothetical protein BT93_G0205 [Corymbia citriodora subsp. variegata]|nr:hypothetical protein BT93_G0205 [Corymbia citriodora subsp. variegata]
MREMSWWKAILQTVVGFCVLAAFLLVVLLPLAGLFWLFGVCEDRRWRQHRMQLVNRWWRQHVVTVQLRPGEPHPTHIARPAPLPREGIRRPSHESITLVALT